MTVVLFVLSLAYLFGGMIALVALSANDPHWRGQLWVAALDFKRPVPPLARLYAALTLGLFTMTWPAMFIGRRPQLA